MYCDVGINRNYANEAASPDWVWKSDCGTESNYEEKKGESSDSFKRACVNWGIGRELYTAPVIRVKEGDCNLTQSKNGKLRCTDRFYVREMVVEDGEIVRLVIYNNGRGIKRNVFEYDKRKV